MRVRSLMGFKPHYPLKQVDHRVERTVLSVLRTPALPTDMRLMGNMVFEHLHQTTFAYACITREQDHVPLPSFHLSPTFQKQADFLFSTHQRCQSSGLSHIKATGGTTFLEDTVHMEGLRHTSKCLSP